MVEAPLETLSFRQIGVVIEEYAVSFDGIKMLDLLDLETQMEGCFESFARIADMECENLEAPEATGNL